MTEFPNDLLARYKGATKKLTKFQRVIFKRFAPNVSEVSDEFNQLANSFQQSFLPQYAGLCWLGASKCEKALGNTTAEIDYLMKSARASIQANNESKTLELLSNDESQLEAALRCYHQALTKLDDDSVMKAAIIREIKKINPNSDVVSSFVSPSHRIYDLEMSVNDSIRVDDFVAALEKCNDIYDDIIERKVQRLYVDVMKRIELTIVLLILLLELPPSRQSPSHIKLFERFTSNEICSNSLDDNFGMSKELLLTIGELILACEVRDKRRVLSVCEEMFNFTCITVEQVQLLQEILKKY